MIGDKVSSTGTSNVSAGRDATIITTYPALHVPNNFNAVFESADNYFSKEVHPSGKIMRKDEEVNYSSKALFSSLMRIGIPFEAAIQIPFQIVPWLVDAAHGAEAEAPIATSDIRSAVLHVIGGLAYGTHKTEEVHMWCAAYVRRFGNPQNQFLKVIDNDEEKDLDYEYVRKTIIPHLLSRIIGLDRIIDPTIIYKEILSKKNIEAMSREIVSTLRELNVYTIRYRTVIRLIEDIIIEPPHPWIVNIETMDKVAHYNKERAEHHYREIERPLVRGNIASFNRSSREFFTHSCAAILSKYGAFLGVGSRYGLIELRRILKLKEKNPSMWNYCKIHNIDSDLVSIGLQVSVFSNLLDRTMHHLENGDSEKKVDAILDHARDFRKIAFQLY